MPLYRGFSHRANSVAAIEFDGDPDAAIARVESAYAERGLPPTFHLTPVCRPRDLEQVLLARGYVRVCPTTVMVADLAPMAGRPDPGDMRMAREVACGLAVASGTWAEFFLMRTNSELRRRGHGRRVVTALSRWAFASGATRAYLQVETANLAARALYERSSFRDAYEYRFLRKELRSSC